jgi:hypothetical protein
MNIFNSFFSLFWYVVAFLLVGLNFLIEGAIGGNIHFPFQLVRYALMGFLFVVAFKRKKLSLWIFSSMILGSSYDW